MNTQQYISNLISTSIHQIGLDNIEIEIEKPANSSFGDYSTNVAMTAYAVSSKIQDLRYKIDVKNPRELASKIVELIKLELNGDISVIEKVDIAGPGFINFYLSKEFLVSKMVEIMQKDGDVVEKVNKGQKVV